MGSADENTESRQGVVLRLTSGQAVAFVLISLATIGISFSLGMKAGQSLPPEATASVSQQKTDRLGALDAKADARSDAAERQRAAEEKAAESTAQQKKAEADAGEAKARAQAEAAPTPPREQTPSAAPSAAQSQQQPKAAETKQPAATPASAPAPAAASAAEAPAKRTGFALQTASVPSEKSAQDEVKRLKRRGLDAWYAAAQVKGSTTYRIKVGPYATKEEATADIERVTKLANGKPILANAAD